MKFLLLLLLVGCAATPYGHATKDSSEFDKDKYQCQIEAEIRTNNWGAPGNPLIQNDFWKTCMRHRGWSAQPRRTE